MRVKEDWTCNSAVLVVIVCANRKQRPAKKSQVEISR